MGHLRLVHSAPSSNALGHPCLDAFSGELDYLYQSLRWLGASPETVDDRAHEVFLCLARQWPTPGLPRSFRPHLFGIALRVMRRHARRSRAGNRTSLGPDDLGRQRRRVLRAKAGEDRLEVLQAALGRVPLLRRAVLVLHEIDGVSIPEIASALSMWRWTARRRLRRARRELTAAVGALTGGDLRW